MKPENVELYVEELVLHGFSSADRYLIGEAVEHELGRLFTERGVPPSLVQSGEIPRLNAGTFEAEPGYKAAAIGAQVARAVYGGLGT